LVWLWAAALVAVTGAWAKPTTPEQAKTVVLNWLSLDALPLGAAMGRQIKEIQTFNHGEAPAYYVLYLNPAGLVLVPADDLVEPIIGFLPAGQYDPSPANPLGALVSRDIPGRVLLARAVEAKGLEALAPETPQTQAQRKWGLLLQPSLGPEALEFGTGSISSIRVAPLVQSRWFQGAVNGQNCYNYYTPHNYICGCVATAVAQLMRYWQWPQQGIGKLQMTYYVDLNPQTGDTRGGDGAGGPYDWANMVLDPQGSGVDETQRQAIGALTYDIGLSVHMNYTAGESDADFSEFALINTFGYSNAIYGYNHMVNLPAAIRDAMVNPNLYAQYPVLFGIIGDPGGHAVVCDGYGYNSATMYHHLNLGWAGGDDAWYNLPTVDTSQGTFDTVISCIYNIYKPGTGSGSGEIIAGRVTDAGGSPLNGVTVSASGGYTATTDANGIYALAQVPKSTTFTVSASKAGYSFSSQSVTTGATKNYSTTTGNQWPIDFVGSALPAPTLNEALDNTKLSFSTGGNANWYGQRTTSYYGGSAAQSGAIVDTQSSQLVTTVTGPGILSFYWKVSSEKAPAGEFYDFLGVWIGSTLKGYIDGEVDWTKVTLAIPAGIHTVTWKYTKDLYDSSGSDCGWVDKVVYTRSGLASVLPLLLY